MLSPGAKGWIKKYFELVENDEIQLTIKRPKGIKKLHFMHLTLGNSGIIFGYPQQMIFAKDIESGKWTSEEKLKLLLFEAHLFVYLQIHNKTVFNKADFIHALCKFYQHHNGSRVSRLLAKFKRTDEYDTLEGALAERVNIKLNLLENKWWVNSLSNAFVYLDVILFDDFEHHDQTSALKAYSSYALNALTAITLSAYSDGVIQENEKNMFNVFLASSGLEDDQREIAKERFKKGATFEDFSLYVKDHWLLKRFLLDISVLLIFSTHDALEEEIQFLDDFATFFDIDSTELDEMKGMVENFVLINKDEAEFLSDHATYEKVYISLTKRWTKILMRNKDKLAVEIRESKELISLVRKATKEDLSKEEREQVKEQLKDLVKAVPSLTIFMLPGGTVLLPLLLRALPDLVPSAFRDNQLEDNTEEE